MTCKKIHNTTLDSSVPWLAGSSHARNGNELIKSKQAFLVYSIEWWSQNSRAELQMLLGICENKEKVCVCER